MRLYGWVHAEASTQRCSVAPITFPKPPLDELHDQVGVPGGLADLVHGEDVRVPQAGGDLRLADEALQHMRLSCRAIDVRNRERTDSMLAQPTSRHPHPLTARTSSTVRLTVPKSSSTLPVSRYGRACESILQNRAYGSGKRDGQVSQFLAPYLRRRAANSG